MNYANMLRRLLTLFTVTAAIELGAGLVLCSFPSLFASLVIGAPLEAPAALTLARIGGAGLCALGIACLAANGEAKSRAASGIILAMAFYNFAAVAAFAYARLGHGLDGLLLWPSAAMHTAMGVWCVVHLWRRFAVSRE